MVVIPVVAVIVLTGELLYDDADDISADELIGLFLSNGLILSFKFDDGLYGVDEFDEGVDE